MILILGDSWGCGEWVGGKVTHSGLAYYLQELGYSVVNRSIPGGSNFNSLDALKNFLVCDQDVDQQNNLDCIFLFWTEWYRDFKIKPSGIYDLAKTPSEEYFVPNNFNKDFYGKYQERVLLEFEKIAKNCKIKIYVIGGASDLDYFDDNHFENVICVCQSLVNLCVNNSEFTNNPVYSTRWSEKFVKTLKKNSKNSAEHLLYELAKHQSRYELLQKHQSTYFPDKSHVNRKGFKKLLDLLVKKRVIYEDKS